MRIRQRWMPLPWGVYGIALALIFGGIGVYALVMHPEDDPSVRVVIPMYALAVYWVVALLCNKRTAIVTTDGVKVSVLPFVVRPPRRVNRENIRHCYIRYVAVSDDGTVLESYYSVGVETSGGAQIDISAPHNTSEEAMDVANRIAHVLNQRPGRPIEVLAVPQIPQGAEVLSILALTGFWLALFIASIFLGFAWEEERVRLRRLSSACQPLIYGRTSANDVAWRRLEEIRHVVEREG